MTITAPTRSGRAIVARLGSEAIALVSDAGTPLISDPGYKLVRDARAAGHEVRAIPGPSAAIAALSISGLPTDRFLFLGFLPAKAKARADAIAEIADVRATLVIYESGPRLGDTLQALLGHSWRPDGRARPGADQALRGIVHRDARRACRTVPRRGAQGRDRHRRRPAGAAKGGQRRRARRGARRSAHPIVAFARRGRGRRAAERPAQARLRPGARAVRQ